MIENCENLSLTRYARMAREEEKMSVRHLTQSPHDQKGKKDKESAAVATAVHK